MRRALRPCVSWWGGGGGGEDAFSACRRMPSGVLLCLVARRYRIATGRSATADRDLALAVEVRQCRCDLALAVEVRYSPPPCVRSRSTQPTALRGQPRGGTRGEERSPNRKGPCPGRAGGSRTRDQSPGNAFPDKNVLRSENARREETSPRNGNPPAIVTAERL